MKNFFGHKKLRGVAILTVMVSLALLMAIVTELSTREMLRYKLAINERDALQAEALALSGANFAQLILMVQEPLQIYMTNFAKLGVALPAYTVWELMPIDSELLKGITEGSVLPDFDFLSGKSKSDQPALVSENKAKDVPLFGPYQAPEGGYGAFRGTFTTLINDEESKISLRKWPKLPFPRRKLIADQLFRVLSKKENEYLFDGSTGATKQRYTPSQIVGNIYDYISEEDRAVDVSAPKESWGRDGIGDKRSAYIDTPDILPKKAAMDSIAELRLIPGVTDAIYQELVNVVSIYGESDTINILSANNDVLSSLFYLCAKNKETAFARPEFETELVQEWHRKKSEGDFSVSVDGLMTHLTDSGVEVDKEECTKLIGTQSKTFTVRSTATVGMVTKTLLMRLRSAGGITTLYQFQYL